MVEILVPLGFFTMVAAIWIVSVVMGARAKREVQETLRQLSASGQTLSPELIGALSKPVRAPDQDLRSGVILTALAIGLALCGAVFATGLAGAFGAEADESNGPGFFIAALIVGAIGAGQLISWRIRRDRGA